MSKTFTSGDNSLKFISEDELEWSISFYRDVPKAYRVNYQVEANIIKFQVRDTIIETYTDPILNELRYLKTYLSDDFEGEIISPNTIHGYDVLHSFRKYVDDLYVTSSGGADLDIYYTSK